VTTLNLQVGASADDGWWYITNWINYGITLQLGKNGSSSYHGYARFTGVSIAGGSSISAATLSLLARFDGSSTTVAVRVVADAADNSASVTSEGDGAGRTRTTAHVDWTVPAFVTSTWYSPSDLSSVIQEVVDRAGWSSGNSIQIFLDDNGSTNNASRAADTYDDSSSVAPKLDITYTAGGGGATVTPGVASLTTSAFAPTVTASDNKSVTPGNASLTTTGQAPTVTASDNKSVTPGVASLGLTGYAPTVSVSDNKTVTPDTLALITSLLAPTVTATANQTATPDTAALVTSGKAPTVSATANVSVSPAAAALIVTAFAPTVTASDHKTATPGTLALVLTMFAATVSGGAPATSNLIDVTGSYAPIVGILGSYTPTINATGSYAPTIDVTGRAS